jgi:hypothetical protein
VPSITSASVTKVGTDKRRDCDGAVDSIVVANTRIALPRRDDGTVPVRAQGTASVAALDEYGARPATRPNE